MSETGRPIYVIGTGGLAREMAQLIEQVAGPHVFQGFIGPSNVEIGTDIGHGSIIGDDDWLVRSGLSGDLVIGIGYPAIRARALERYIDLGDRFHFPNLIHPSAVISEGHVRLGRGNAITAGCIFTTAITVGDFNLFNLHTTVGHDASVGSYCVLNPSVNVSGGVRIRDRVLVGTGAQILEGRVVAEGATIGAGAVVTRDVDEGTTVIGVPARPLQTPFERS